MYKKILMPVDVFEMDLSDRRYAMQNSWQEPIMQPSRC